MTLITANRGRVASYSFALAIALGAIVLLLAAIPVVSSWVERNQSTPAEQNAAMPIAAPTNTDQVEALSVAPATDVPAFTATYHAEWLDENGEHFNGIHLDFTSPHEWRQTTTDSDWPEQIGTFAEVKNDGYRLSNAVNGISDETPIDELMLPVMFAPQIEEAIATGIPSEGADLAAIEEMARQAAWQTVELKGEVLTLTRSGPAPPRKDWNPTGEGVLTEVARFDVATGLMLYHAWSVDGNVVSEVEMLDYVLK